jgi:uncharacterized lipoprotein YmbA
MHRFSSLLAACIALGVAACASSPPTLVALPSPALRSDRAALDAATTVRLRHVRLPEYLDGFPVMVGRDRQALVIADRAEWAERPSQGVTRVLRDALAQRLGSTNVLIAGDGRRADAELAVEFMALDPEPDGLHLDARWSFVCRASGSSHAGRTSTSVATAAPTPQAVAAATSEALSRLADAIVDELRCAGRG